MQDVHTYACEDGEVVRAAYRGRHAALVYKRQDHRLEIAPSASGSRYVDDGLQWWTRGLQDASLAPLKPGEDIASAPAVACKVQAAPF